MKTNKQFIIYSSLTILWTLIIFSFSLQTGEESSQVSGGIVSWIVTTICPAGFPYAELLETLIRKGAHFAEYFILGVLVALTIRETKCTKKVLAPWILGTLVACADETIQLFSNGRSGQLTDVMLDSAGVLFGCVMVWWICYMGKK